MASAANCLSATAGLVGWWPGDGNANTLVGTNHGLLQGGATATASGLVSQAFEFNGIKKQTGLLWYGYRYPVDGDIAGRAAFHGGR